MSAHSKKIIEEFCKLCSTAYGSWYLRKYLFDNDSYKKYLQHRFFLSFFGRFCDINQEHWILQLVKLHDPSVQSGRINLTLTYMLEFGDWDKIVFLELQNLKDEMDLLSNSLRTARNKILSHNDLATILAGNYLGEFEDGKDVKYFNDLNQFATIIHEQVIGGPCVFDDTVKGDIEIFMEHFKNLVLGLNRD